MRYPKLRPVSGKYIRALAKILVERSIFFLHKDELVPGQFLVL